MNSAAARGEIRVRMYNVGFGDSFLITYPDDSGGQRRVLVDCGSIAKAQNDISTIVGWILEDCTDKKDGQCRIDVVVATHRHRDHVSGFSDGRWANVQVSEVWMPWTEDPTDPEARRIRSKQTRLAATLNTALSLAPSSSLEPFKGAIVNAAPNESAMSTLHRGFAGAPERRFLPKDKGYLKAFTTSALPEATIHALGPSRDEKVIRDMDPPGGESFHAAAGAGGAREVLPPFGSEYWMSTSEFAHYFQHLALDVDQIKQIEALSEEDGPLLAASLDKAINGTSLVLLLEIGPVLLLFPGDAQWGSWENMLANSDIQDLMRRTSFYKVGHHGSHNATPRRFVEELLPLDAASLVSTRKMTNWPKIPVASLLTELGRGDRCVARSDTKAKLNERFNEVKDRHVDILLQM